MIQVVTGSILLYTNLFIILAAIFLCFQNKKVIVSKLLSASFILLTLCLLNLVVAFVETNYSLILVAQNSHEALPLMYKVTAIWGNHTGSFFLLTWMVLATFLSLKHKDHTSYQVFLVLYLMFNIFIVFNSNPFALNLDIIKTGHGFNPLLQDVAIAIHPPILYLGNTLLLCIYCINFNNKNTASIINLNKLAWAFLTFGIALGSWWAYRELGWGGIWFWDPVENISLLPWLCSTALLHYQKRKDANLAFKILAFLAGLSFVYGLVITRSGIIASVHSFAVDMNRGAFLMVIFMVLAFLAFRSLKKQKNLHKQLSTNFAISYNNVLLFLVFLIIICSTLYPILMSIVYNKEASVSELFFISSLTPILFFILIGIAFFTHKFFFKFSKKLILIIFGTLLFSCFLYYYMDDMKLKFKLVIILSSIILLFSLLQILFEKNKLFMHLGHASFGLLMLAITLHYSFSFTENMHLPNNSSMEVNNFKVRFVSSHYKQKDNFLTRTANLEIVAPNKHIYNMSPELRFFPVEKMFTVESSIINYQFLNNIYITTGDMGNKLLAVEFKYQAYINLIWLSASLLGVISILSYLKKRKKTHV